MRKNQSSALKELEINQLCKLKLQNLRKQLKKDYPRSSATCESLLSKPSSHSKDNPQRLQPYGISSTLLPQARFSGTFALNYIRVHQMQFTTSFQQITIFASQSDNFFCWQLVTIADIISLQQRYGIRLQLCTPFRPSTEYSFTPVHHLQISRNTMLRFTSGIRS